MANNHQNDASSHGDGKAQQHMSEAQIATLLQKIGPRPQPTAELSATIRANVKAVWREEVAQHQAQRLVRRKVISFAVAAGLVLSVGASWLLTPTTPASAYGEVAQVVNRVEYVDVDGEWRYLDKQPLNQSIEVRTGSAGMLRLHLGDGMDVRVGANSRVAMRDGGALTLHSGVIYVDSNDPPGVNRSLRVTTPFGLAEDIGTQFAVRVAADSWQVQVRDGLVQVKDDGLQQQVNAGDRIEIDKDNGLNVSQVDADDDSWAWIAAVSPGFLIEGASLQDYLEWFARETGKKVTYSSAKAGESASATILHGSIDGLLPLESLSVVLAATDFHLVDSDAGQLIIDR